MNCIRCDAVIDQQTYKSEKYCSQYCSKLYLKSQWRKRNKEIINKKRNEWRNAKNGGNRPITNPAKFRDVECLNCGSTEDLQVAHIKPLDVGGTHKYVITLCRKHHHQFDTLLRDFWDSGFTQKTGKVLERYEPSKYIRVGEKWVREKPTKDYPLPSGVQSVIPKR